MFAGTALFAAEHFGQAALGNRARTRRLVQVAEACMRHPGGTLPEKLGDPAMLKAAYRLMDRPEVTHAAVLAAHRRRTHERIATHDGPLLVICDSTELDFTTITSLKQLGPIGHGGGRGYIAQQALVVDPHSRQALGLAEQILHRRATAPRGETKAQSLKRRSRESRLWVRATDELPGEAKLIVVCDRGADTFEMLEHEARSGRRFVIRAKHDRWLLGGHAGAGRRQRLNSTLARQPAGGTLRLAIPAAPGRRARQAQLRVSWCAARLVPPPQPRGEHSQQPLAVWTVRVWEPEPPRGAAPLAWTLLTNEPIAGFEDAQRVIGWYECRWVIEEYHKAQKTGCQIEALQFTDEGRLEPMIALLSVVALTLLNLRDASRHPAARETPATVCVDEALVEVLSRWRHGHVRRDGTMHDFCLALARLGGHPNRRRDPPPGWLVLWRGWTKLQLLLRGAQI